MTSHINDPLRIVTTGCGPDPDGEAIAQGYREAIARRLPQGPLPPLGTVPAPDGRLPGETHAQALERVVAERDSLLDWQQDATKTIFQAEEIAAMNFREIYALRDELGEVKEAMRDGLDILRGERDDALETLRGRGADAMALAAEGITLIKERDALRTILRTGADCAEDVVDAALPYDDEIGDHLSPLNVWARQVREALT